MIYTSKTFILANNQRIKYELYKNEEQLSYRSFLKYLQEDEVFRSFFINLLGSIPFNAYQWETPSVNSSNIAQPFEFVASKNDTIDLPPDSGPFQQYFQNTDNTIAVFDNLGGDAKLIAPLPLEKEINYSHIGRFTQNASLQEQHTLWERVGQITQEQISDQPLWLNTAGGGVAWLHVRLDSRPKYYRHHPYCS